MKITLARQWRIEYTGPHFPLEHMTSLRDEAKVVYNAKKDRKTKTFDASSSNTYFVNQFITSIYFHWLVLTYHHGSKHTSAISPLFMLRPQY